MEISDILLKDYIQPAAVKMLFDEGGNLKKPAVLEKITVSVDGKEQNLKEIAEGLPENIRKAPKASQFNSDNSTEAQQAAIAESTMSAVNYILGTLQGVVVSGQNFVRYVSKEIIKIPEGWVQFSTSNAQNLEVIRKRLNSEELTIVDVAKLFELQDDNIVLKDDVKTALVQVGIQDIVKRFENIGKELQTELTRGAEAHSSKLADEFAKLQAGKMPNWYDFDFLNKQPPKAVEMFKSCMSTVTDYIITAVTMMKDFINYAYSLYSKDPSKPLISKNSDELFDTLARETKGASAILWAELAQTVKAQVQGK